MGAHLASTRGEAAVRESGWGRVRWGGARGHAGLEVGMRGSPVPRDPGLPGPRGPRTGETAQLPQPLTPTGPAVAVKWEGEGEQNAPRHGLELRVGTGAPGEVGWGVGEPPPQALPALISPTGWHCG